MTDLAVGRVPGNPPRQVRQKSTGTQVALLTFLIIPAFLSLLGALIIWTDRATSIKIAHSIFIVLAILLPAGLYYYFISTKRESLLNAFIAMLDRLGLFGLRRLHKSKISVSTLQSGDGEGETLESEFGRERRVRSYFERFEALYGTLPPELVDQAIECTRPLADREVRRPTAAVKIGDAPLSVRNILPVLSVMILSFIGWIITLPLDRDVTDQSMYFTPRLTPVAFAFLGAYFFSLQILIWRFVRKDLGPTAYLSVALRLTLAMIAIWVADEAYQLSHTPAGKEVDKTLLVLAFAVGVFPIIVWQFVTGVVKRLPGVGIVLPNLKQGLELSELDGLTIWHETRLEEEDIENVANMASSDVVDLLLNTRFAPNRIIDWVDQAILFTSIASLTEETAPKARKRLEALGIRSATSLLHIGMNPVLQADNIDLGENLRLRTSDWIALLGATVRTFPNLLLVEAWKGLDLEPSSWVAPTSAQPNGTGT